VPFTGITLLAEKGCSTGLAPRSDPETGTP